MEAFPSMPQQDFAALSPQICLDLLPFLHLQVWPEACHPLCQLSRGGHLLSELPHSLMKSAFCPAKDQTEAPAKPSRGSGHIRSETQAPCEVLHEMLLPASPRNLYVLLGCSQGPYIRISLQLSHTCSWTSPCLCLLCLGCSLCFTHDRLVLYQLSISLVPSVTLPGLLPNYISKSFLYLFTCLASKPHETQDILCCSCSFPGTENTGVQWLPNQYLSTWRTNSAS